ncbi:MAG: hypothetical protein ABF264_01430 [Flavobacteriales bacterium]
MRNTLYLLGFFLVIFSSSCSEKTEVENSNKKQTKAGGVFQESEKTIGSKGSRDGFGIDSLPQMSLKLTPFVPSYNGIGESGSRLLKDRLNAAITKIGFGGEGANPRFIIGPSINLLTQDVTATSPTKYANTYEINFMVVDLISETIFSTYKTEFKGVGDSPEKAFISGIRNINFDNQNFINFLKSSELKIVSYFENNCATLLAEAGAEAGLRNFENAFAMLKAIPKEAKNCFTEIQNKKLEYFQLSLNLKCSELLAKMQAELGKYNDQTGSGFNPEAMHYYSMIDSKAECYSEAQVVYKNYLSNLKPQAKRDWEQKMREYNDQIEMVKLDKEIQKEQFEQAYAYKIKVAELESQTEIEGNKRLLAKYKHDESPWLIRLFSSGSKLFKGEMSTN